MSTRQVVQPAKKARAQASAPSGIPTVPKVQPNPQIAEQPEWARQLLAGLENLNSRIGLLESGVLRPSFSEAASEVSEGGVALHPPPVQASIPVPAIQEWQTVQKQRAPLGPPPPRMGESGSGYTLLPNGKMVRNKRPAHKPLVVRQAINWRSDATTNLVTFLKERGIGKSDAKPVDDAVYLLLVESLAKAKAYYVYTKMGGTEEVHIWRERHKNDIMSLPLEEDAQSWADEMSEVASQATPEGSHQPEHPAPGQPPVAGMYMPNTHEGAQQQLNAAKAAKSSAAVGIPLHQNSDNRNTIFSGARPEISDVVAKALANYAQKHGGAAAPNQISQDPEVPLEQPK